MSNAISVLDGAFYKGAVTVRDTGLQGMITLRGDLSSVEMEKAVKSAVGLGMPDARGIKSGAKGKVAWMSPDELLLFCDYELVGAVVAKLEKALKGTHFMAANVSDARAMFTLEGAGVREVIAKGSPANMSETALPQGEIRRSRLGQLAVAFWLDDTETLHLVCFRSVGAHVFDWLCTAAKTGTLPTYLS